MSCARLGFAGEIEVTSLAGSVREACLWSAGLAGAGGHPARHAARHRRGDHRQPSPTIARSHRRVGGSSTPTGRWCVPVWCATTPPGTGCGSSTPTSPICPATSCPTGVRGFEVLEELGFSERRLRQALSARDVGAVEILVRGVDVDPDALRPRLRLRGSATGLSRHRPDGSRGGKPGNGIHLSSRPGRATRTLQ